MAENLLKELCNRLLNLFRQTESKEENAKDVACNRLRVVLMQDRTNLTPELLQRMRKELIELLSKYVEMDKDALELNFDQEDGQMALMLSIPVIRAKDEAEIQAELDEEDEENEDEDDENSEEDLDEDESLEEDFEEETIDIENSEENESEEGTEADEEETSDEAPKKKKKVKKESSEEENTEE